MACTQTHIKLYRSEKPRKEANFESKRIVPGIGEGVTESNCSPYFKEQIKDV